MISIEDSVPVKNDSYLLAEDIFFTQFNDISFYIEDTEQENFYYNILKKIFPNIQIEKIFPLNGKDNVINECRRNIGNKRKVFIVDKDFDDILNKKLNIVNLFYLNRYSIENYLVEEKSIIEYIISEKPKLKRQYIKTQLNVDGIIELINNSLKQLIHLFILVQKKCPQLRNVSLSYERFYDFSNGSFTIRQNQLTIYVQEISAELWRFDKRLKFESQLNRVKKEFNHEGSCICITHFPGKFIVKMLKQCIESLFGLNSRNIESFSYMIATNSNFESLNYLKDDINSFIN